MRQPGSSDVSPADSDVKPLADRPAGSVDDGVVGVQDGDDVGAGEDRAELERDLAGVGVPRQLALVMGLLGGPLEELAPLLLVGRDAVVDAACTRA
jgi:hypothetical protein